jgi:hypothetical protein
LFISEIFILDTYRLKIFSTHTCTILLLSNHPYFYVFIQNVFLSRRGINFLRKYNYGFQRTSVLVLFLVRFSRTYTNKKVDFYYCKSYNDSQKSKCRVVYNSGTQATCVFLKVTLFCFRKGGKNANTAESNFEYFYIYNGIYISIIFLVKFSMLKKLRRNN